MMTSEMLVMAAVPMLARVSDWFVDVPTVVGLKLRLAGETCRRASTAMPVSGTVRGSAVAELAMDKAPARVPD